MADVRLVAVLDTDPGFYHEVVSGALEPRQVQSPRALRDVWKEIRRSIEAFGEATGGRGVVTVHTSPFFRRSFLQDPFADLWRQTRAWGFDLALHAHEDRPGGGSLVDRQDHMAAVISASARTLRACGVPVETFRSGYCAFSRHMAGILEEAGLWVDLSAAPGMVDLRRGVDWRNGPDTAQWLDRDDYRRCPARRPSRVLTVPLGWDGMGDRYEGHYLINERNGGAELAAVWQAVLERAERRNSAQVVLFLCHTYGLCDPGWREQARRFLQRASSTLAGVVELKELFPFPARKGAGDKAEGSGTS